MEWELMCSLTPGLPASDLGPAGVCLISAVALRRLWDLYPYPEPLCECVCIRMPHPRGAAVTTIHILVSLLASSTPEAA